MPSALNLTIQDNHLYLKFKFDKDIISQVKTLGMRWSPQKRYWYAKITKMFTGDFLAIFPEAHSQLGDLAPISLDYSNYTSSSYLMEHQKTGAENALVKPRWGYFHDIGIGKTLLGVELVKQKKIKALVVCPLAVIETAWMEDLKNFAPGIKTANLWMLKQKKSPAMKRFYRKSLEECELALINFESFRSIKKDLDQAGFSMLLIDESAKIKDGKSLITKAIIDFSDNMDFVYPLSGNPAPNSEMEYWSQLRIIDPMLFGRSFYAFRNEYFYSSGYGGFKWKMKEERRTEFLEKLASVSEVVRKEDVLTLPGKTENIRKVYLNTLERKAYEEMKRNLVIEFGGQEIIAVNAAVKQMKLREGTSGFYIDEDKRVVKIGQSKLNALEELLEEIGDRQVVIWTHFHFEADEIEKLFGKISKSRSGVTWGRVDGTIKKQTEKMQTIERFKNGDIQYIIAHPGSIGHGVPSLVVCSYMVYFSLSHSWELFNQSGGRIYRKGQVNECFYYYLIADRSVDEVIYKESLLAKGNIAEAVFRYIKSGG